MSQEQSDELVDPDLQPAPGDGVRSGERQWDVLLAIAIGGVVGSEARYALGRLVAHPADAFPWSTLVINATGCLLIGALMVVILDLTAAHRLARPLLGVGILGGYTTFSTFAVDADRLLRHHRPEVAASYVVSTVVVCAAAVSLSTAAMQALGSALLRRRARNRATRGGL